MSTLLLFNRSHGKQKYHSHVSYLCFFYCRITRETMMMMMMIRHTAQSGTVRSSLVLRFLLIYLSRYPLLSLLTRPSCAHYHNSDISLFFALSHIHRFDTILWAWVKESEKRDFNEFFFFFSLAFSLSLLSSIHTIHTNSHFLLGVCERDRERERKKENEKRDFFIILSDNTEVMKNYEQQ